MPNESEEESGGVKNIPPELSLLSIKAHLDVVVTLYVAFQSFLNSLEYQIRREKIQG